MQEVYILSFKCPPISSIILNLISLTLQWNSPNYFIIKLSKYLDSSITDGFNRGTQNKLYNQSTQSSLGNSINSIEQSRKSSFPKL